MKHVDQYEEINEDMNANIKNMNQCEYISLLIRNIYVVAHWHSSFQNNGSLSLSRRCLVTLQEALLIVQGSSCSDSQETFPCDMAIYLSI